MYDFLHNLLEDKKGGEIFRLFSLWHIFYIALAVGVILILVFALKGRSEAEKEKTTRTLINIAFGLYILDFFLMPIAYGEINIENLPFHVCTAMCVACFISTHVRSLEKYRLSFVMLGFVSGLVYLIYPAGVMWHAVHPLSYRVIQSLLLHATMTVYGFLTLFYEYRKINIRECYRDLLVIVLMTAWALIGNYSYNADREGYSHFFNWFFVVRDPFYALPETVAPFVMPVINISLFFAVEMLLHLLIWLIRRGEKNKLNE